MAYAMQELLGVLQARAMQQQLAEQAFWNRLARQMLAGEAPVEMAWTEPREPRSAYRGSSAAVRRRRSRKETARQQEPQSYLTALAELLAGTPVPPGQTPGGFFDLLAAQGGGLF